MLKIFESDGGIKTEKSLRSVRICYLNCMSIRSSKAAYSIILEKLFEIHSSKPEMLLDDIFKGKKPKIKVEENFIQATKVVVLDEIDQIVKDERFTYNLLEWIHLENSRLVLILISNIADLTSRMPSKHQSRMKMHNLIFKPYSHR